MHAYLVDIVTCAKAVGNEVKIVADASPADNQLMMLSKYSART